MNKKYLIILMIAGNGILFSSCNQDKNKIKSDNPFLCDYNTPYNVQPFDKIKPEHFIPAYKEAIKQQEQEIDAIIKNTEKPSFSNTIEAFDYSGNLLNEINGVFNNITQSNTSDTLQIIAKEVSPLLSQHDDNISLNAELFKRIKAVYDDKANLKLTGEQNRLLEETYKRFVRGGAALNQEQQKRLREINKELSMLNLKFGDNTLNEVNEFKLIIDKKEDLAGLPQNVIDGAKETAKELGMEGKWVFGLQVPSFLPFMQYADNRDLREKLWKGYVNKGNNNNKNDNKENIVKIVNLRLEKAKLLGYKSHAEFILEKNMAKNVDNVYKFLNQVWEPAIKVAKIEAKELQALINKEGKKFKLQPWDWRYYAEKLRKAKYDLDEEQLRPYFELENVKKGLFTIVNKLYGIKMIEKTDVPKYHKDAVTYEVQDADGTYLGLLYMDFHPRASKRGGAWMDNFRGQCIKDGKDIRPIITVVCNFTKPTAEQPALLTPDEVGTLFHEFGHALHGMLTKCTYPSISGTSVARDFVELPSQIMENWASDPEALKLFAKHYKTGEIIPDELVKKMIKSQYFNQGFATSEFLAAAFLDMDYHSITEPFNQDVLKFEANSLNKIGLIPEIIVRYRSTYFNHIFSGGYSSGYYGYTWAEVLDADAFEAFKEKNIFDKGVAESFRKNILEKGGTEDPMVLYKNFRGKEPSIIPLLKRRGLDNVK